MKKVKDNIRNEYIKSAYHSGFEEGYKMQAYEILMLFDNNTLIEEIKEKLMQDIELL